MTKTERPLKDMSAKEIRQELVEDACGGKATPLPRFVMAIARLKELTQTHPETLFIDIQNEVREKSGREMPLF